MTEMCTVQFRTCDAVLFDLDGVLVDSNPVYERHWHVWAKQHGVSFDHIAAVHHGRPARQTIRLVAPHLDAELEACLYNDRVAADNDVKGVGAYEGVPELLRALHSQYWAIVTSAQRELALRFLQRLDLPAPSVLVTSDDVVNGKPSPDPYLKAASGLGRDPRRCVVIEDAPAGIAAAKAAGAFVVAIPATNPPDMLHEADALVSCIANLSIIQTEAGLTVSWAS